MPTLLCARGRTIDQRDWCHLIMMSSHRAIISSCYHLVMISPRRDMIFVVLFCLISDLFFITPLRCTYSGFCCCFASSSPTYVRIISSPKQCPRGSSLESPPLSYLSRMISRHRPCSSFQLSIFKSLALPYRRMRRLSVRTLTLAFLPCVGRTLAPLGRSISAV